MKYFEHVFMLFFCTTLERKDMATNVVITTVES